MSKQKALPFIVSTLACILLLSRIAVGQNFTFQGGGGGGTIIQGNPDDWSGYNATNTVTFLYGRDIVAGTLLSQDVITNRVDAQYTVSMAAVNTSKLFAVTTVGSMQRSLDGGATWTEQDVAIAPYDGDYFDSAEADNGAINVIVAIGNGVLARSPNNGVSWVYTDAIGFSVGSDIDCSSEGRYGVLSGAGEQIYISDDFCVTWLAVNTAQAWSDVCVSSNGSRMAASVAGAAGSVYVSTDYGTNWSV